jgi:hypothetical protein
MTLQSTATEDRVEALETAVKTSMSVERNGTSAPLAEAPGREPRPAVNADWRAVAVLFASTILVSAFLLFQVQPLISKYILPWFGGSPAVWTTCMLFFQLVLFAGYLYAHLLTRFLSPRQQGVIHLSLMSLAILLIFPTVAPADSWKPLDSSHPTARILALLGMTVGLPYFVLSTTGPLVQAWFARTWPNRSPYRLYALSNVGSLAALITYPFLFEPAFASDAQAGLWTWGFGLFAVLCGLCAAWIFRLRRNDRVTPQTEAEATALSANENGKPVEYVSLGRRVLWIVLPALASLMLLATTNFVCQDVAVIPFLWVIPLSLYLLTFIICFDHPRWYRSLPMSIAAMALVVLSAGAADVIFRQFDTNITYIHELTLYFSTMFVVCMVCHGQLVRLRPTPVHLTEYYLLISLGGALGGIFVSLIAPQIFETHFEWTIALAGGLAIAAVGCLKRAAHWIQLVNGESIAKGVSLGAFTAVCLVAGAVWLVDGASDNPATIYQGRNFYGTVSVLERDRGTASQHRTFFSGGVGHGKQYVDPAKRRMPIAYFAEKTGIGRTLKYFQGRPDTRVGIVGMGVGVVATYAKPGHYFRLYEINEQVNYIAHNYFTFLNDCEGKYDVVLADARLALERELADGQRHRFNVLALDAFTGDAPPVHLLTDEAFQVYLQHLEPDGVIVVNITNRYINLVPVVSAVAKKHGLKTTRVMTPYEPDELLNRTDFMMLSRDENFIAANPPVLMPELLQPEYEVPLWTDKYSNLFSILKR